MKTASRMVSRYMKGKQIHNIQLDATEMDKMTNYKYLGQTIAMRNRTSQEGSIVTIARWSGLGKYR